MNATKSTMTLKARPAECRQRKSLMRERFLAIRTQGTNIGGAALLPWRRRPARSRWRGPRPRAVPSRDCRTRGRPTKHAGADDGAARWKFNVIAIDGFLGAAPLRMPLYLHASTTLRSEKSHGT